LCGGRSRRFGRDKALADADGAPMGGRVVAALRAVGCDPVVAIGGSAGGALGVPTVPDLGATDRGPLSGLATALRWARTGLVLVVPCDLPLLTDDHLRLLVAEATLDRAAVALDDNRPQPSLACWPASRGLAVQALVDGGVRRWREALSVGAWTGVPLPARAMADADTEAQLRSILAVRDPNEANRGSERR